MDAGEPGVQLLREIDKALGVPGHGLNDRLVEAYPYGKLHKHRAQTPDGVHALLLVQLHGLLGDLLRVLAVLLPDLLDLRLEAGHGPGGVQLLAGQGVHGNANSDGEGNDAQPEIAREDAVQEDQRVQHRLE